ncbi:MAG: ROK family protein [Terriglobia bacterium]
MKHVTKKNQLDKLTIESLVWRHGALSRSELHELTDLQHSDISKLARQLINEGRLVPSGRGDNPMGRKRTLLRLNDEHSFVVGVGFDDREVHAATMDLHLNIRATADEPTSLEGGAEKLASQLLRCTKKVIRQSGVNPKALIGIGVAGSGLVSSPKGIFVMSSTIEFLKQVPLRGTFENELGVPTIVEDLTRAKTVAERTLGAGEMADHMIYIDYGPTGIGAGIIIDGKLFYGSESAAGEFGHTHMVEDGPACKCGSFGCLEAIAGAAALGSRIRKALAEGSTSEALVLAGGDPLKVTGWTVLEAAGRGDKSCSLIVEEAGRTLGLGLANLVNLFNPSVLVLDRRLSVAGEGFLEQIVRIVRRQALPHSSKNLSIRFGKLGSEANVLGVGSILLHKHFEIPALKPPKFMIEPVLATSRGTLAEHN